MYLFMVILGFLLSVFLLTTPASWGMRIAYFLDFPCLLAILLIAVPILLAAGFGRDFLRAFRMAGNRGKEWSITEIKRSVEAVGLFMKAFLGAGVISACVGIFVLMHRLSDPAAIGPYLSVALLGILYGLTGWLLMLPIRYRLKARELEYMQEASAAQENGTE